MAKKKVYGKQMTVVWHEDDLNISHKNGYTVDALINKLREQYIKEADLTTNRGKVHEYMGTKLDYREQGKAKIDMTDHLEKIPYDLPDKYQGKDTTPAANHLFEVNETAHKLNDKDAQTFHTIMAKLLFLCKQSRTDIWNGVAFLTMRVIDPDKDDDKKLSRILKYISGARDIILTLESTGTGTVKFCVDAAFGVHHDMKIHTGRMM